MLMFNYLFMEHLVREPILVYTINKVWFWDEIDGGLSCMTDNSLFPNITIVDYFFQSDSFVLTNEIETYFLL